ncbi:protein-tyrosine-phosphatase MKP1-like isoform X1 [Cucurbita moschata]|uniref:Protein-tyrosine-phosphatase MKP1-like isoform X1 n=1 Tax=Cucurbita moschata TaxID=3662 RepID=A0A6J1GY64_CUCMO|nr:protein-tyrosine-phosphatase MKP1-like isoform X1 [Cucurbita moschata]XP_022957058.1 protein-tyrosine-phosphatase MKP1-like isoform X1 [Cucurbita moschata]
MVGSEDSGTSGAAVQLSGNRKLFWRSASWSASRSSLHHPEVNREGGDPNGNLGDSSGPSRIFPAPLTPRSQQHCKARSCLPPLQPLSIARRSLDEWPKAGSDDIGEWPQPPTPSGRGNCERLKLDLSTIQRNPDKNCGLVKRDKIAFFDKECSKVAEHVYLGGDAVARDRDILKQNGITHVLNCVGFVCPEYFKDDFVYRTLWLQDSPSEDITSILYDVFDYFEDVREQNGRVFVHCCQGVSRSTSLVIAYLMWREGQSFDDAFQYVKAARGIADPNMGFACQLLQCQKRVHAFPLSPSSLLRMYRVAPHSPYDPLHLVPKMLNDPSTSSLDSRGAFIIHVPSAIFVWIGKNCEAIMERDARGAVVQIVRYEKVHGPIYVIKEGEEPTNFWDSFANLLPLMDKSNSKINLGELRTKPYPGERRVDSYDLDFEIFQKAITGGFVPPFPSSENEHETHLPVRESSWSMLRRKFASGNMREFVSAPRISLSRVYSDSLMMVHFSAKPPSPSAISLSSSSSSPIHLSPDSLSSDSSSSTKYFSESSLDSPSASSPTVQVSSTLSSFSNMHLISSNSSLESMPNGPETRDAVPLESSSRSFSFPSKKFSPSLAERRGSAKSLTLPTMPCKIRATNSASRFLATQEDGKRKNKISFSLDASFNMKKGSEPMDNVEDEQTSSTQNFKNIENGMDVRVGCMATSQVETEVAGQSAGSWKSYPKHFEGGMVSTVSNGKQDGEFVQPMVYCWPELAKIAAFDTSYLHSKAAVVIFSPSRYLGKKDDMMLYIWVGNSFDHDLSPIQVKRDKDLVDVEKIDWVKVGQYVLTEIGLPENTEIKIVKEGEETEEFLARLSLL